MNRSVSSIVFGAVCIAFAFSGIVAAQAPSQAEILGPWDLNVNAMGRDMPMKLILREDSAGELAASVDTPQGAQDAENVRYEDGKLSWSIRFGPQELELSVEVEGQTFAGNVTTPFGEIGLSGQKVSEEVLAEEMKKFDHIIGDWTVYTTFNDEQVESDLRFQVVNNEIIGTLDYPGGLDVELGRISLEGNRLSWMVAMPFVSRQPARVNVTLEDDGKFSGTVRSVLGDIPIQGEMIDTRKLVLSPYDDPTRILGKWTVETEINGQAGEAVVTFYEENDRLHATIQTDAGELQSDQVDFKIISETMSVIRVHLAVPDFGDEMMTFEMIVNDDTFEGEEITNTDLEFLISGQKVQ